jgi:hypothetical protein
MTMSTEKFDAYGEVSPTIARNGLYLGKSASATLNRAGQIAFWLLVVVIVSARIIWYPAVPGFDVSNAGEPKHAITP